MTRQFAYASI